jgi:glycosyltransferase involved in cell wall biosynthesis
MSLKVAIIGTRGIPNHYGGFEQCAEYLAVGLVKRNFEVIVYNSHSHPYHEKTWKGVEIIHCYDPEDKLGTAGQFIYDLNCIIDSRKRNVDVVLILGYTSSSVWGWLLPQKSITTTNMDGLEWKRTKFSKRVKKFLLFAEKLAIKFSDHLIADSIGIQDYLRQTYNAPSTFIPYGAHLFLDPDGSVITAYDVEPYTYNLLVARLEPENSIEIILDGVVLAKDETPFLVIGKHTTKYGEYLKEKFKDHKNIRFIGGIYNINVLNNIRYYSKLYFHGHTVGGTNPSLLEAMASNSLICANDNPFNKYILGDDAYYFSNADDIAKVIHMANKSDESSVKMLANNSRKIEETYTWETIVEQYASHLLEITHSKRAEASSIKV